MLCLVNIKNIFEFLTPIVIDGGWWFLVFNATFNNISIILGDALSQSLRCDSFSFQCSGHLGRDRMVVGFTTIMQSVPITTDVVSSNPVYVALDTILCDKVCQ